MDTSRVEGLNSSTVPCNGQKLSVPVFWQLGSPHLCMPRIDRLDVRKNAPPISLKEQLIREVMFFLLVTFYCQKERMCSWQSMWTTKCHIFATPKLNSLFPSPDFTPVQTLLPLISLPNFLSTWAIAWALHEHSSFFLNEMEKKQLWIWGIQGGINCLFEIHTLNDRVKKLAFFMYARMMETALALLETLGQLTLSLGRGASFSASQEEEKPM